MPVSQAQNVPYDAHDSKWGRKVGSPVEPVFWIAGFLPEHRAKINARHDLENSLKRVHLHFETQLSVYASSLYQVALFSVLLVVLNLPVVLDQVVYGVAKGHPKEQSCVPADW